jgi:ABC-type transport system involved in multi-copper enzyme maturation permease subunit
MTQRWLAIAKKDFQYTRRSNVMLAIIAIFTLMTLAILVVPAVIVLLQNEPLSEAADLPLFEASASASAFVIPITALVGAYLAVAGERQSGRIRLLLGMPPTRRDLVVGKFVSRSAVILVAVAIAYALAIAASLLLYQEVPLAVAIGTAAFVGLLGVTFVGIAVGISALVSSRIKAIALVLVFYMVTIVMWDPILFATEALVVDAPTPPEWLVFLDSFPPSESFSALYDEFFDALGGPNYEGDGFYRSPLGLVGTMLVWTVVPVVVGYLVFERVDLS